MVWNMYFLNSRWLIHYKIPVIGLLHCITSAVETTEVKEILNKKSAFEKRRSNSNTKSSAGAPLRKSRIIRRLVSNDLACLA